MIGEVKLLIEYGKIQLLVKLWMELFKQDCFKNTLRNAG